MNRNLGEVLTVKQFLRLPETKPALEFIRGRVLQKFASGTPRSLLRLRLSARILEHAEPPRLGLPYTELRCTFGGDSLVPDVAYIERGRIPRDARGRLVEDVTLAPDIEIEILSPSQSVGELTSKLSRAVRHGVRLAWLIQPRRERAFVFRPGQPVEVVERDGALDGEDVLPGLSITLAEVFGWLIED